jgi:hypothetical protein
MNMKTALFVVLCLLVIPLVAWATDYKAWIPLLPPTVNGLTPSGEPDGMNMEMGGQKWSSLNQEYTSRDGKRSVDLVVMAGKGAPQAQSYHAMAGMNMNMETGDQVIKTLSVAGHKGMLTLDKKDKTGTLVLFLKNDMLVVVNADPATNESDVTRLVQHLPLAQLAAKAR